MSKDIIKFIAERILNIGAIVCIFVFLYNIVVLYGIHTDSKVGDASAVLYVMLSVMQIVLMGLSYVFFLILNSFSNIKYYKYGKYTSLVFLLISFVWLFFAS